MQNELAANYPDLGIQILGVNPVGYEGGNGGFTLGWDIPWLQDVDADHNGSSDVWTSWDVTFRDVVILDGENTKLGAFNLTVHDLQVAKNYNTLRQMLVDAATPIPEPSALVLLGMAAVAIFACARHKTA